MLGKDIEVQRVLLTADNASIVSGFYCGKENIDINEYICNDAAYDNESVSYVYLAADASPVAFVSLSCSSIEETSSSCPYSSYQPAVLIDKFALDEKYHHLPYDEGVPETFAQAIFSDVVDLISEIASSVIGAKYIILYSTPKAHNFYLKCLMEDFEDYMAPHKDLSITDCKPMYRQL